MLEAQVSVTHCPRCQFTIPPILVFTCPVCGEALRETLADLEARCQRGSWLPVAAHWVIVALVIAIVAVTL